MGLLPKIEVVGYDHGDLNGIDLSRSSINFGQIAISQRRGSLLVLELSKIQSTQIIYFPKQSNEV